MSNKFCSAHPCSALVTPPARYCEKHTPSKQTSRTGAQGKRSESERGGNNSGDADTARHLTKGKDQDKKITDPFYGTARWQKFRRWYRKSHPLCEICLADGFRVVGDLVDHIIELSDGGAELDPENAQTLCNRCHGKKTAAERGKRGGKKPQPKVYSY